MTWENMDSPLVSVIMPARNAGRFIAAAIDSVIAQSIGSWELIVVDDGSEDETPVIVRRYADSDDRIRLLRRSHRRLAEARNAGIRESSAPWIAFLDADDLWHPDKLSGQFEVARSGAAEVIFTGCRMFFDDQPPGSGRPSAGISGALSGDGMYRLLVDRNRFAVSSVMLCRKALVGAGCFDPDPRYYGVEDYDLWLTLARRGSSFLGLPELLTAYRVHGDSLSRNVELMISSMRHVMLKHGLLDSLSGQRSLRRFASILLLDEFFISCRDRDAAFGRLGEALIWSPLTLCRPRRAAAVVRAALAAALRSRPRAAVIPVKNNNTRRPAHRLIEP